MTNNPSSFTGAIVSALPWQEIFNWFAAVAIPALIGLWRKHASTNATQKLILESVIAGVENSTKALGPDGRQVKSAIHDQSISNGVDLALDRAVQNLTTNQK